MQRNNLHTQFLPVAAVAFSAAIAILRAITTAATFFLATDPRATMYCRIREYRMTPNGVQYATAAT